MNLVIQIAISEITEFGRDSSSKKTHTIISKEIRCNQSNNNICGINTYLK